MVSSRLRSGARAGAAIVVVLTLACPAPAGAVGLSEERAIGARFALEARRRIPLVREPALTAYLRRVGERLIARLDGEQFSYRFFVVRDPGLNAFAVPGGYVYVHAGLLAGAESEAELAGVLAHEIVHVHAHHVVRQQEQTALANYATLAGLLLSAVHPVLGVGAVTAGAAVQLKYRRQFEQEADHAGIGLMSAAGFDPAGMPRFLRRVQREQQLNPSGVPPYFLSHPLTEDRIGELDKRVSELSVPAARAGGEAELAAAKATVRVLSERRDAVLAEYKERLARAPESAEAQHLLGLVYLHGGQPERAEPLLASAAAGRPRARGDHGRALARLGRLEDARGEFEAHLALYPDDPTIRLELGRTAMAAGEFKQAAAFFEAALGGEPELDEAEYALAECRGKLGDERAQWWHLGRALELRGSFDRALHAYEKARELSSKNTPEREQVEKAIAELQRALSPMS